LVVERRLAAILAADVVGYSRLMAADEAGTHARLKALRQDFIQAQVVEHHGRIVKLMGDGVLVEFASVVDAVECAAAVQGGVIQRQADAPEDQRIRFRIGINIGDIIIEDDDIYGDGVNIATRLEALAGPDGICVARNVYNQVKAKVDLGFAPAGEHRVKNITEPVTVYRALLDGARWQPTRRSAFRHRGMIAAAAAALLLIIGGGGVWMFYAQPEAPARGLTEQSVPLELPDKPSIAVLPFTNLSGNIEQDGFADAVTEDIITGLARFRDLFVISRNSSFRYKDQAVDVKQVGRELGVRFVLEGSVRRADDRLRVTAQLIDATTDEHLWAETYDRELTAGNVFDLQDAITAQVVAALGGFHGKLYASVANSAQRKNTDSLEAYELYYLASHLKQKEYSEESHRVIRDYYQKAIEKDSDFALAYMGLGWVELRGYWGGWATDPEESLKKALEYGQKALALDSNQAEIHLLLGDVYALMGDLDRSVAAHARARALNPNDADIKSESGGYLAYAGRSEEAIELVNEAMRLNPFYPDWYLWNVAMAYYPAQGYDTVINAVERMRDPPVDPLLFVAASYAQLGRSDEAQAVIERVLELDPDATVAKWAAQQPYKNPEDLEHYKDGLRKAGLPEKSPEPGA
jgi:adenylate cyclase